MPERSKRIKSEVRAKTKVIWTNMAYLIAIGSLTDGVAYRSFSNEHDWLRPTLTTTGAVPTRFIVYRCAKNRRGVLKALVRLEQAGLVERETFKHKRSIMRAWKLTTAGQEARRLALAQFVNGFDFNGRDALGFDRKGYDAHGINFEGYDKNGTYQGFAHLLIAYSK